MIQLTKITEENFAACINLRVEESQKEFVKSNLYTLAQTYVEEIIVPLAITKDEKTIGFVAWALDEDGDLNLIRFMVDKQFQGRGYGKRALKLVINEMTQTYSNNKIWLSLHPKNVAAKALYENYGFKKEDLGIETEDEIFMSYEVI